MKQVSNSLFPPNNVFMRIVIATVAILSIPLIAMQFTTEVDWDATDFIVMGSLLFGMASLFVLATRRVTRRHRIIIGGIFAAAFLLIWAELAVGVFTNLGS